MGLQDIKEAHISEAAKIIDQEGIARKFLNSYYYVVMPNGRTYPFKYLAQTAHRLVPGNENIDLDFSSDEATHGRIKDLCMLFDQAI